MAKILCLVPLPPPITGAALASRQAVLALSRQHDVTTLAYQRGTLKTGTFSLGQLFRVMRTCWRILALRISGEHFDYVYHVVSSSFWGNLRDLAIWLSLGPALRRRTTVHLHGGIYVNEIPMLPRVILSINRSLIKSICGAIILGPSFRYLFDGLISADRLHIIGNYVEPELLLPLELLERKYRDVRTVNILFLSNMLPQKGFMELLEAYQALPPDLRARSRLRFAGQFSDAGKDADFRRRIAGLPQVQYLGPVVGLEKRELLWSSHVFCLPTYYLYEGQPISILEAYAAGLVVLATANGGIKDIFRAGENGYWVNSPDSVKVSKARLTQALVTAITSIEEHHAMGIRNRAKAVNDHTINAFEERLLK